MVSVLGWLRRLDEDALQGRATSRLAITVPLYMSIGAVVAGCVGFVSGVYIGLGLTFDGYAGFWLPYLGALLGSLAGGSLGLVLALRHRR
jgi:hypothetical protein